MAKSRGQALWTTLLILAGIGAAFVSPAITDWIAQQDQQIISSRTVVGVLLGQLVGLRRKTLLAFIVGPLVGFAAGIADIKAFVFLYETLASTLAFAVMVPTWGLVLGLLVAAYQPSWRSRVPTLAVIAVSDFVARYGWGQAYERGWNTVGEWMLPEALAYVPTIVFVILLTRPSQASLERRKIKDQSA